MNGQPATARADEHEIDLPDGDPDALRNGLQRVLLLANGSDGAASGSASDGAAAVPIQGKGADTAALFVSLAADLLEQVETSGGGFARVRLDGVLQTDDGGVRGWGYLIGEPNRPLPPRRCELVERTASGAGIRVRCSPRTGGS